MSSPHSPHRWQIVLMLLLWVAVSSPVWGGDKKPPASATPRPAAPAKPAAGKPQGKPQSSGQGRPSAPSGQKPNGTGGGSTGSQGRPQRPSGLTGGPPTTKKPGPPSKNPTGQKKPKPPVRKPPVPKPPERTPRDRQHFGTKREPTRTHTQIGDKRVTKDDHGRVRDIEKHGLRVHQNLRGGKTFVHEGPNERKVVGYGPHVGYVGRKYYRRGGREYYQRTYVYGGRRYAVAYRSYPYHGVVYYRYAPAYYYHPAFYGWAYNPWASPVYYNWGWAGNPWFVGYGYYFTPYPAYANASLWLTDYLLAESLQLAYAARAEAAAGTPAAAPPADDGGAGQVALSPEVKQMISEEVQRQLAAERAAAEQPAVAAQTPAPSGGKQAPNQTPEDVPEALDPRQKIFIVASNLDLADDDGNECAVTPGDVLMRMGKTPDADHKIAVNVVSSKQGDCPVDTNSSVDVSELQEMHNAFREKLDAGLKTLAENQGKNGLPAAPDTGRTAGEVAPPVPDANAESELKDQQRNVEQMEQEIAKPAQSPARPNQ